MVQRRGRVGPIKDVHFADLISDFFSNCWACEHSSLATMPPSKPECSASHCDGRLGKHFSDSMDEDKWPVTFTQHKARFAPNNLIEKVASYCLKSQK